MLIRCHGNLLVCDRYLTTSLHATYATRVGLRVTSDRGREGADGDSGNVNSKEWHKITTIILALEMEKIIL